MKNCTNLIRIFGINIVSTALLMSGLMFASPSAQAELVTFNLTGGLSDETFFGGTGLELGSFSGSFTYDLSAVDQLDTDDMRGRYLLTSWSLDFFDASGVFAGQLANTDSGDIADITIRVDPDDSDMIDNIALEFYDEDSLISPFTAFGVYFDLASVVTDGLPSDLTGATFNDFGILLDASGFDESGTFVDNASITAVPVPPALLLFGSSLLAFFRFAKQRSVVTS